LGQFFDHQRKDIERINFLEVNRSEPRRTRTPRRAR
jgi:hypothetical protein